MANGGFLRLWQVMNLPFFMERGNYENTSNVR